jgi:DNA-binding response OmpR family regulator
VLGKSLQRDLTAAGFAVELAANGKDGEFLGATENFDLAVLDLGLPEMSGLEVLRRWRSAGNELPVLVLTARNAWLERIEGFKAGADDYLGKPFHFEELSLRLLALAKRRHGHAPRTLLGHGITLDEEDQSVVSDAGARTMLTAIEFRLLRRLMMQPGSVLSKTQLAESIYECERDHDSNVIEVYINRLRKKIGESRIVTRRGQGYMFDPAPRDRP